MVLTLVVMTAALVFTFTLVLAAFMLLAFVLALMLTFTLVFAALMLLTFVLTLMLALLYFGGITTAAFLLSVTAAATGHANHYHCHHQANYNLFHLYLLFLKTYLLFVAH